jgi:hypothetical protein
MTSYTILRRRVVEVERDAQSPSEAMQPEEELWEVAGEVDVPPRSRATSAVRKYLDGLPADERTGTYVATPTSAWTPVTVKRREVLDLT